MIYDDTVMFSFNHFLILLNTIWINSPTTKELFVSILGEVLLIYKI